MLKWRQVACVLAFLNVIDVMAGTRRQNGAIKCVQFPVQKIIFRDAGSVSFFFCWKYPGGCIRKNDKYTKQALFFLTESVKNQCAGHHESNS